MCPARVNPVVVPVDGVGYRLGKGSITDGRVDVNVRGPTLATAITEVCSAAPTATDMASVTGMFGSLVFAAIKRDKGVKDWSHLIPGQGGFLDQLDSVIFAAPVFYHVTQWIWG